MDAQRRGESLCHQLIMGQGKTTVIAPLLALMIADGNSLVISIVPPHLLPSARAVLREKLAAALQRPVYGMVFDRYTPVTPSLLEQLRHASALRGVLLTEPCVASRPNPRASRTSSCRLLPPPRARPARQHYRARAPPPRLSRRLRLSRLPLACGSSCVKSVMLKFVDSLVELQGEVGWTRHLPAHVLTVQSLNLRRTRTYPRTCSQVDSAPAPSKEETAVIFRLQRLLGLRRRHQRTARRSRRSELRGQLETLSSVLGVFRRSVVLLDEVDVLLHPLRSELNWPQGERHPIHFAPMRWQLPFHLLDGALYPDSRKCTATWHESPEAQLLLSQLCTAHAEGLAQCALQAVPHSVLLERSFYNEKLRPLLTRWALLWLRRNRVQHGTDEQIIAYLTRDMGADNSAAAMAAAVAAANIAPEADDPLSAHAKRTALGGEEEAASKR